MYQSLSDYFTLQNISFNASVNTKSLKQKKKNNTHTIYRSTHNYIYSLRWKEVHLHICFYSLERDKKRNNVEFLRQLKFPELSQHTEQGRRGGKRGVNNQPRAAAESFTQMTPAVETEVNQQVMRFIYARSGGD